MKLNEVVGLGGGVCAFTRILPRSLARKAPVGLRVCLWAALGVIMAMGGRVSAEEPAMLARVGISEATAVVKDGKANALIVTSESQQGYGPLVEKIRKAVKEASGAELPWRTDAQVLE